MMAWSLNAASPHPQPVGSPSEGTIHLSPVAVCLSAAVLVVNGFISLRFKLGLHVQLVVASLRMVVQLSLLGYVLVPIFLYDKWWLVLLYSIFMLMVASLEAVQRPSYSFQGVFANTLLAMAASSGLMLTYMVLVVLALRPVWEAQYVIPLLGMLLGNATSAISVGLSTVLDDLAANRAVIEHLLALGANRFEATDEAVRRALKVSMTPLLNQMSVMGIVAIPGMMTGQILAGGDPTQAARYQMVIIFVVVATTCLASVASIYLAVLHIVDSTHTFRVDRLIKKQPQSGGARARWAQLVATARRAAATARRKGAALGSCLAAACCCCFCPPTAPRRRPRAPADGHGGGGDDDDGDSAAAALLPQSSGAAEAAPTGGAYRGDGGGGAAASPFAAASSWRRRRRHLLPSSLTAAVTRLWTGSRRGAAGAGPTHGTPQYPAGNVDRLFSAESTSSALLGAPPEGLQEGTAGVTSPLSAGSMAGRGQPLSPKLSWDERLLEHDADVSRLGSGGVYDAEEGNGGGLVPGSSDQVAQQPLLGLTPPQSRGGWSGPSMTHGSSVMSSGVSTVVAVGGWLGSQASAGLGAAWGAVGRWRSGGSTVGATGAGAAGAPGAGPGTTPPDQAAGQAQTRKDVDKPV